MAEMSEDRLKSIIRAKLNEATGYRTSDLTAERDENLNFYRGEKFGNEIEGQSQVVSRDVLETIEWIMPDIMETFHGSDQAVEFEPTGPEDEAVAEQVTDYINHVYTRDNDGFMLTYTWFHDAAVQKVGVVKHWCEEEEVVSEESYSGLTEDHLVEIALPDEIEIVDREERIEQIATPGGMVVEIPVFDVTVSRTETKKRIVVANVPPEDWFIERLAPSLEKAKFYGYRMFMTRSELIETGYDKNVVNDLPAFQRDNSESSDQAKEIRYNLEDDATNLPEPADKSMDDILIHEGIIYVDFDGDGVAERRRFITAGLDSVVLLNEPYEDDLFTIFSPIPQPHTAWGLAVADLVKDVQLIKSTLWRRMLDGLYRSVYPTKVVVDGQVNYDDVTIANKQPGTTIRAKALDMIRQLEQRWDGAQAFPMLEYLDGVLETRTGISQVQQGSNPNLLNNQTATGVNQVMSAAQKRVKMLARVFAETGMKKLFRSLLKLVVKYQDRPRTIRLRNQWVEMDPRGWNADMDVTATVGLGTGNKDQLGMWLQQILAAQKEAIMTGSSMVTEKQIYNTLEQLSTKVAGFPSVDPFFIDPDSPEAQQAAAQRQQQSQGADPMMQQIQMMAQVEMAKLMLDRQEAMMKDDRERDKIDAETMLKARELEMKFGSQVNIAVIRALMERDRYGSGAAQGQVGGGQAPPGGPARPGGLGGNPQGVRGPMAGGGLSRGPGTSVAAAPSR